MWTAMLIKELRETLWIAALALLAYLAFVTGAMGLPLLPWPVALRGEVPFAGGAFLYSFCLVSVPLVIALGFRQATAESVRGTWLFLLHRPAERWQLIAVKLATGVAVYLICAATPILLFAWWAATPGTHASPFEWSMTVTSWQAWAACTAVYFAAFLAGIRPARWWGSRLFPLLAAGLLVVLTQVPPLWEWARPSAVLLLDAWLIACILDVARTRDY